jgi:hypothetical protein
MPDLDSCISSVYAEGHNPSDSGSGVGPSSIGSLLDPDDYDPDDVIYSLDFSKFYNSAYMGSVV